jgi:hypothetical protein
MKSKVSIVWTWLHHLYRRLFLNDAREPAKLENRNILPEILSFLSGLLLAFDLIRKYFQVALPEVILRYAQHVFFIVAVVSLIYIASRVRTAISVIIYEGHSALEFVYPKHWRRIAKVSLLLLATLYITGLMVSPEPSIKLIVETVTPTTGARLDQSSSSLNGPAEPEEISNETEDEEGPSRVHIQKVLTKPKSTRFDLVVQNQSDERVLLTKVGVFSRNPRTLAEGCQGTDDTTQLGFVLALTAKYIVEFDIDIAETWQPMTPPLVIPPKGLVRFSVSALPTPPGRIQCASRKWSSDVSVALKNSNNEIIQTGFYKIDSETHEAEVNSPNEKRLALKELQSSFPRKIKRFEKMCTTSSMLASCIKAVEALMNFGQLSSIDVGEELEKKHLELLEIDAVTALGRIARHNKASKVRSSAIDALAELQTTDAINILKSLLQTETDPEVKRNIKYRLQFIGYPMNSTK